VIVFVTQALKAAARALDAHVGGKGAVVVSAAVSVALTALAYAAGWAPVTVPACDPLAPLACVQGWLVTARRAFPTQLTDATVPARILPPEPDRGCRW